jgi:hypothetical protein
MTGTSVLSRRNFARLVALGGALGGSSLSSFGAGFELRVTRARKVFSDGRHNAFTGLVWFKDRYFITFRSAGTHMTVDGQIRLIASDDAEDWSLLHTASRAGQDLRDPKLAVLNGRLFVYFAERPQADLQHRTSMAITSEDGRSFSEPQALTGVPHGFWLWHAAERDGALYGTAYRHRGTEYEALLLRSTDGLNWEKAADFPLTGGETYLDFVPDGTLWAFVRNNSPGRVAYTCSAKPPYTKFENVRHFPTHIGGPMIMRLEHGCVLITRQWDPPGRRNLRTEVFWQPDEGELRSITRLPSGGDTSYATWLDTGPGRALVSYYSSHEHKMDVPLGGESGTDSAHAEHSTGSDIFLAEVSFGTGS